GIRDVPRYARRQLRKLSRQWNRIRSKFSHRANGLVEADDSMDLVPLNDRWKQRLWPGPDFVPPKFDGRIIVYSVANQPVHRISDKTLGWQLRSTRPVEVHEIKGNHATILREPNVQSLAGKLAQEISNCLT